MDKDLVERLKEFIENEMKSCSMDICGFTSQYVFRSWGGQVPLVEIESVLSVVKKQMLIGA